MQHDPSETSVMISLRQLDDLETERLEEEERARASERDEAQRERELHLTRQRAAEQARDAAEEQGRAELARAAVEEAARLQALQQAEIEGARIRATAKAQLEVAQAQQLHERELLVIEQQSTKHKMKIAAMVGTVLTLLGVSAAGVTTMNQFDQRERAHQAQVEQLAAEQQLLLRNRVATLDGLRDSLAAEIDQLDQVPPALSNARTSTQRTRSAVGSETLSNRDVDAYQQALAALADELGRAQRIDRLAGLDQLHAELRAKLESMARPGKAIERADVEVQRVRRPIASADPTESELTALGVAVEQLGSAIAAAPKARHHTVAVSRPAERETMPVCDPHDPLCGRLPGQ